MGSFSEILIVGTGALACLFAARLSAAGVAVGMLGSWHEALEALRGNGVCLVDETGKQETYPVQVYEAEADRLPPTRLALVLVKSWQTAQAAQQLIACLEPGGLALTLQNGLGNREILAKALGSARVILGATTVGAALLAPGEVRLAGPGKIFLEKKGPGGSTDLEEAAALFEQAGFPVEWVSQPDSLLWGKLVVSASINPLTAILNVPNGELLRRPSARELMRAVALEAAAVAAACNIDLPYAEPVEVVENVARLTSTNYSSMLKDVRRGAPTEIDVICGAIVTAASAVKAPAPLNQALWLLVKALVQSSYGRTLSAPY
jgi:2-dehydropantoate 2-reductase